MYLHNVSSCTCNFVFHIALKKITYSTPFSNEYRGYAICTMKIKKKYIDNSLLNIQLTYKISLELETGDNLRNF